jgi:RNA polymerase sigma-70 factor (ECF subfamily)
VASLAVIAPAADDLALVAAAQQGDRDALERLLRRHYDRILAVCRRITGNNADAADAAQEALIAITRGLPRFDGRAAFSTWAYRVAANASLDELRRRGRRPAVSLSSGGQGETGSDHAIDLGDPSGDRGFDGIDAAVSHGSDLERAIAALPDEFRVAVVLRDVHDLDYSEIADRLGVPVGTVKSRIARGRAHLARSLHHLRPHDGNRPEPAGRPTEAP